MRALPGQPYPLGVRWDGRGVHVAVVAEHAIGVDLCLFDQPLGAPETARIALPQRTGAVWHGHFPDLRPGQLYGLRVRGPWAPAEGHRCNPHKLLLDPHARAVCGAFAWHPEFFDHVLDPDTPVAPGAAALADSERQMDIRDSAPFMPKGLIVDEAFDWGDDHPPRVADTRVVIYECHVNALTARHPDVPPEHRGRYLGVASQPIVKHLQSLGVTSVELLPVHQFITEHGVARRKLQNAWGYNTLAFFAPHAAYASGDRGQQVTEFKQMVKALHAAGLEVLLDVVYNHTAEAGGLGPTLSLRGLDNRAYYRLRPDDPRHYVDCTGCGNTLNTAHVRGLQLVLDSLRYWVTHMHVDGFRFDLAPALGRDASLEHVGALWDAVLQDPVLAQVRLCVEPWDLGPDGWRSGAFPSGYAQWNDRFRDCVRRFWRGDAGQVPELASRLSGSSDIFAAGPASSVNFVTCHDGFTLADLVAHQRKHNEANGEANRDGNDTNWSSNGGMEGETSDPAILARRERIRRSLLASAVLSQGITLLSSGDELGRTQHGNNNAYCQPELIELDWTLDPRRAELLAFARRVLHLYHEHPVLRRRSFFRGRTLGDPGRADVAWVRPDGCDLAPDDWHDADNRVLGMLLPCHAGEERDDHGRPIPADTLLLLLNGGAAAVDFTPPAQQEQGRWVTLLDSADSAVDGPLPSDAGSVAASDGAAPAFGVHPTVRVRAHALVLLRFAHGP